MKKLEMNNTKKSIVAALFFSAISFGFAQTKTIPNDSTTVKTEVKTNAETPEISALKTQIATNPNDTKALVNLATAYQNSKDFTNALETWKNISTLLPDWAPAYYSQAYVYQSMKDDANATLAYEKYISKVKPEELEANKKNLAYAEFYVAYNLKDSDKESAKQHLEKSLQYDPMNADALKLKTFLNQ
ncbi:hypothetical protein [Halpernia sp.]|uniref:hypothetical protein n=1 Tax=Halpernia sp. TaxID=2782209 RepID=UPI003A92996F